MYVYLCTIGVLARVCMYVCMYVRIYIMHVFTCKDSVLLNNARDGVQEENDHIRSLRRLESSLENQSDKQLISTLSNRALYVGTTTRLLKFMNGTQAYCTSRATCMYSKQVSIRTFRTIRDKSIAFTETQILRRILPVNTALVYTYIHTYMHAQQRRYLECSNPSGIDT